MRIGTVLTVLVVIAMAAIFIFGMSEPGPLHTLGRVRQDGVIRIGFANDIPFGYADSTGRLTGEAPEVAREILGRMGIRKLEGVLTEFDALIPGLKSGRFDMIAAGMFITPGRAKEIAFSEPTYCMSPAFMVKKGNPKNLHGYKDVLKDPNTTLAVMMGAVEGNYAQAVGIPESQLLRVPNTTAGWKAVELGEADALALTSLSIMNLIKTEKNGDVEKAEPFHDLILDGKVIKGYGAFGFRKEDRDLLLEFNRHLKTFIGTKEHLDRIRPFGLTESEMPGKVTAAQLSKAP